VSDTKRSDPYQRMAPDPSRRNFVAERPCVNDPQRRHAQPRLGERPAQSFRGTCSPSRSDRRRRYGSLKCRYLPFVQRCRAPGRRPCDSRGGTPQAPGAHGLLGLRLRDGAWLLHGTGSAFRHGPARGCGSARDHLGARSGRPDQLRPRHVSTVGSPGRSSVTKTSRALRCGHRRLTSRRRDIGSAAGAWFGQARPVLPQMRPRVGAATAFRPQSVRATPPTSTAHSGLIELIRTSKLATRDFLIDEMSVCIDDGDSRGRWGADPPATGNRELRPRRMGAPGVSRGGVGSRVRTDRRRRSGHRASPSAG
jgi:hypothetical protein